MGGPGPPGLPSCYSTATSQILMKGFAELFRLGQNRNGGLVMIYIRDDIPSRLLSKHVFPSNIEGFTENWILGNVNDHSL